MLWLRKIVFYIFALVYLILCPLIIARMLGFTFDPLVYRFIKTGLIYVSTNPPNATVYIDGRMARQKTPTILRDLPPGKHFIRIELGDYNDWEKNIPVVGKKATVLANILLIPEEWPIQKISDHSYQNIFLIDDDILLATNSILKNIDIYRTTQSIRDTFSDENTYKKTSLFSENFIYADGQLVRLFNAPKSPFVLLEVNLKDEHRFLWVKLNEDPPVIEDISDLFPHIPISIAWDNSDNDNVFAFDQNAIYRVNVKDKAIYLQDAASLPKNLAQEPAPKNQVQFLINDNNDLLTKEGRWIRIYPKENTGNSLFYNVAKSRPSTNIYFEDDNGELFYLDNDTGALFTAQILPYHPILNIPIPDALRNKTTEKEPNL